MAYPLQLCSMLGAGWLIFCQTWRRNVCWLFSRILMGLWSLGDLKFFSYQFLFCLFSHPLSDLFLWYTIFSTTTASTLRVISHSLPRLISSCHPLSLSLIFHSLSFRNFPSKMENSHSESIFLVMKFIFAKQPTSLGYR